MRYVIRQKIFSFADKFTINNEDGRPMYDVVGKFFTLGDKLNIYDMDNNHLIYIEQKIFRLLAEYILYENNEMVARVKKQLSIIRPRLNIDSIYGDFTIDGNVLRYNFDIKKNGNVVASIRKKLLSLTDVYTIDIDDSEDQAFILSLVIVIDQIFHHNKGASAGTSSSGSGSY